MDLTEEIKSLASSLGADLVGVASIERFEGTPEFYHPRSMLPQTQSVISIAIRHLHGLLEPQKNLVDSIQYQTFGYGWLSHVRLNTVAFEVSRYLEDRGCIICPFPSFGSGVGAHISNRHVAIAAGVARFGWHNLAITPRFGTRQRFVAVLTSARLEPDPMIEEELCDSCMKCVEACPAGAISYVGRALRNVPHSLSHR